MYGTRLGLAAQMTHIDDTYSVKEAARVYVL